MKLLFKITDGNRSHLNIHRESALSLGYSEAAVTSAEAAARGKLVSAECRRRIYAVASVETQMNMAAASAIISSKTSSSRSDTEKAVLAGMEAAIGWVGAMRAAAATLAADPEQDFTSAEHWPAVPVAATAVVDQF